MKYNQHVQALAAELAKAPQQRNASVLQAARINLAQMSDEDITAIMSLVQPPKERATSSVDNEYLRRAIGVAVAMAGERNLGRVMEIYERENIFMVREPMLRDIVELEVEWFLDVLWDWAAETGKRFQVTGAALLRDTPAGRAYAASRTLKLWETAATTEEKLAAISRMIDFGLPQFLDPIAEALDDPALRVQAMTVLERNCSRLWTSTSPEIDLQKKARLSRKILDIHKMTDDQKTRDFAKKAYFALIIHAKTEEVVFANAKQLLEKAETEEMTRVLFLYVLGQLYKDRMKDFNQMAAAKKLVEDAIQDSREAVQKEAQSTMTIIETRDNPPKYTVPAWVENR